MYNHLSFPEYVIEILKQSVQDFQPNYMFRFSRYDNFRSTFPDFDSFLNFYGKMLKCAQLRAEGDIKMKIEPKVPTLREGFVAYHFYDQIHINPIMRVEVKIEGNQITLEVPPF